MQPLTVVMSDHEDTLRGLEQMMRDCLGEELDLSGAVPAGTAILTMLACKVVLSTGADLPEWFPRGGWATTQAIVGRAMDAILARTKEAGMAEAILAKGSGIPREDIDRAVRGVPEA